jgi:hypothetical protein
MIFGLLIIGMILLSTALKNTNHEFGQQLQSDVLGQGGFLAWIGAILAIGALGYLPGMRTPSHYLLGLLGVVVVVRNQGLFSNAQAALQNASGLGPAPAVPTLSTEKQTSASAATSAASGGAGGGSSAASALGTIASYTATGAAIGGPYGAAAGAVIGVISSLF